MSSQAQVSMQREPSTDQDITNSVESQRMTSDVSQQIDIDQNATAHPHSWDTLISSVMPTTAAEHFEDQQFDSNDESFSTQSPQISDIHPHFDSSDELQLATPMGVTRSASVDGQLTPSGRIPLSRDISAQMNQILSMEELVPHRSDTVSDEPITQQDNVSSCDSLLAFEIIEPFEFDLFERHVE